MKPDHHNEDDCAGYGVCKNTIMGYLVKKKKEEK